MKIDALNGCEFHFPTSGGRAGKFKNKTSALQVRRDGRIAAQFRFKLNDHNDMRRAIRFARNWALENGDRRLSIGDRVARIVGGYVLISTRDLPTPSTVDADEIRFREIVKDDAPATFRDVGFVGIRLALFDQAARSLGYAPPAPAGAEATR